MNGNEKEMAVEPSSTTRRFRSVKMRVSTSHNDHNHVRIPENATMETN